MNFRKRLISLCLITLLFASLGCMHNKKVVHISGAETNDLVQLLQQQGKLSVILHSTPMDAVKAAGKNDGILVLAGNYPKEGVRIDQEFLELLKEKDLKAYIEFPSAIAKVELGDVEKAKYKRIVVSSDFFQGMPDSLAILGLNGLHYVRVNDKNLNPYMVAARVAGFDNAMFGLPDQQLPVLFELPEENVLVATTNLSNFVTGRYAPQKEWGGIWQHILQYVLPEAALEKLTWKPVITPSYAKEETLPADFQKESVRKGIDWYVNARMLIPSSYNDTLQQLIDAKTERIQWSPDIPVGDGSAGVFECIFSEVKEDGSQPIGIIRRGDCISESSMAFATAAKVLGNEEYSKVAEKLLDYYLFESIALKNEYGDPTHPAYGLIPWGVSNYAWYRASYGDDNARFLLAAWTTSALLKTNKWDDVLIRSLVALLRTTGQNGFRGSRIDLPDFEKKGWLSYYNQETLNLAPHFESYLWACYLWAYDKTGDEILKNRAVTGIKTMMENYPDNWTWTNGIAQEKARMILPLAWLLRVENTPENKEMLMRIVQDVLVLQDESGAIREELGDIKMGHYPPPQSNEAYGTTEASLIAKNGDPVSDLLYTTNFAFLGLHEAAHATNDPQIKEAADQLAGFLCRIQVSSPDHPEIDGGWMRAFDYRRFEHWGSNADAGWGAWAIESGWTQGWITSVLALRELGISIWDVTKESTTADAYFKYKQEMYPRK